jgi:hypothetical protein
LQLDIRFAAVVFDAQVGPAQGGAAGDRRHRQHGLPLIRRDWLAFIGRTGCHDFLPSDKPDARRGAKAGTLNATRSWMRQARMPFTLLAHTDAPTPLLQIATPRLSLPATTAWASGTT